MDDVTGDNIPIKNKTNRLKPGENEGIFSKPATIPADADANTTTIAADAPVADATGSGAVSSNEQMIGEYKVTKDDELIPRINNAIDAYRVQKGVDEYFVFKGPLNAMTGGQKKSKSQKRGGKKQRQTKRKMGGRRRSNRRR